MAAFEIGAARHWNVYISYSASRSRHANAALLEERHYGNLPIKARDQSLESVLPLKWASQGSEAVFTLPLHGKVDPACMSGRGRRYDRSPFLLHATGALLPFHPPWPIIPFIYLFTWFCAAALSFYERNSSLCTVEGPSQQIKTQSINTLPLGNWRPTSLYLKGICVICKAASVCVRVIHCGDCCRGLWDEPGLGVVSIKLTCSPENERTRGVGMFESMCIFSQSNPKLGMCELKCALNQQEWASWTIKSAAFSWNSKTPKKTGFPSGGICLWAVSRKGW